MQVGYLAFGFVYPSIQLLFHFLFNSSLLPFDPCLKPSFSSLFSVTCRCYKQILIATLPLVGSTSYTIKTSNTKPLGSSLLVWGCQLCATFPLSDLFVTFFIFHPPGSTARRKEATKTLSRIPPTGTIFTPHFLLLDTGASRVFQVIWEGFEVTQFYYIF